MPWDLTQDRPKKIIMLSFLWDIYSTFLSRLPHVINGQSNTEGRYAVFSGRK